VATSYGVEDAQGTYQGHTYVASFALPKRAVINAGEIAIMRPAQAPGLMLFVKSLSLVDAATGKVFPLRSEWVKREAAANPDQALPSQSSSSAKQSEPKGLETKVASAPPERWRRLAPIGDVAVFENLRLLPRVWLASKALDLSDDQILSVIRSGRLPDGNVWDPRRLALVESPLDFPGSDSEDATARAETIRHDPNRVEVRTAAQAPSILVLSDNHYPGWLTYVDGSKVETLRVDYNLRGVPLTAGEHRVEFVYRPKSVFFGLAISLFVLVVLVLWSRRVLPEETVRRLARNIFSRELETPEK
jgi:hypothetical protein